MPSSISLGRRALACGLLAAGALAGCTDDSLTGPAAIEPASAPSLSLAAATATGTVTAPDLPRASVSTVSIASVGRTLRVNAGGSLQRAIDSARAGDVLVLQAGATFTGNFRLPKKSGTDWITIRTSTPDAELAEPGTRVTWDDAARMPKIRTSNGSPAIATSSGAHHYRLVGLEIMATSGVRSLGTLVRLGDGSSSSQYLLSQVPAHLIIDRSYIHGQSSMALKRCVELNSAHTAIVNSLLSRCHSDWQESQGIAGWNGPGPFLIENNYVSGAGINVMFGGADAASESLMPADITVRRNHLSKPLSWKGDWLVKNLLELKVGRRVLIEGNILENSWVDGQVGFAMVLKSAAGSRARPFARTEHVTVRGNIIRNSAGGINVNMRDGTRGLTTRYVRFEHNLLENIGRSNGTKNGRLLQVGNTVAGLQVEHNTMLFDPTYAQLAVAATGASSSAFVYRDNIVTRGYYGVKGDGTAEGTSTLARYMPGSLFAGNAIVGGTASRYPGGNAFPASLSAVGFRSASGGDYELAASSPLKGTATDGTDPGADMTLVRALTAGVAQP